MRVVRVLRVAALFVLFGVAVTAMTAGILYLLLGEGGPRRLGAAVAIVLGFWGFVFVLDTAFGRPPQFSKRPWERPWEDEER